MNPTLKQLEHLRALHEQASFSLAANHCAITQSSLSASIKELENILQQKLVNRGRKNITLTAFGLEVLQETNSILQHVNTITAKAQTMQSPLSGPLRLGIIPTIAPYMLPTILPNITREYPKLELQLHEAMSETLVDALHKGQIDLALMAFPYDIGDLHHEHLFDEPFYAAVPKGTFKSAKSIKLQDLEPDKLLLLEDGHCLREHALEACKLQPVRQSRIFRASSLPTLIEMVRHGFGITLLPEMACKSSSLPQGIEIFPIHDKPAPTRSIGLCWNLNNPRKQDFKVLSADIRL